MRRSRTSAGFGDARRAPPVSRQHSVPAAHVTIQVRAPPAQLADYLHVDVCRVFAVATEFRLRFILLRVCLSVWVCRRQLYHCQSLLTTNISAVLFRGVYT